jgi:uncharacterized protein
LHGGANRKVEVARAYRLSGERLHLQHGPIDLVIGVSSERDICFRAATERFATVLEELVGELAALRSPMTPDIPFPNGSVAKRMHRAALPHTEVFVTRMAAVAGSVADEVLGAMLSAAPHTRAYVNNGGDIALHLQGAARFTVQMADPTGGPLGQITLGAEDGVRGIATSGRSGRSHSFGIADSVTVLAETAAAADVAATLIANAVDLPGHKAIARRPACELSPDSDLGDRLVTTACGALNRSEVAEALERGKAAADAMLNHGLIRGAALFLKGEMRTAGAAQIAMTPQSTEGYALA